MSNWCSLNGGIYESDKDAVEIQVEKLLGNYQNTLKLHQRGNNRQAKQHYEDIISHDLVQSTSLTIDNEETPLSILKFLVFKNYGSLLEAEYEQSQEVVVATQALENYLQAVRIDPSEHSLWYHIGHLSHQLHNHRLARMAYETGLYASSDQSREDYLIRQLKNKTLSPMQWKCLEGLCKVLYDIRDYDTCEYYVDIVHQYHKEWTLGTQLKHQLSTYKEIDTVTLDDHTPISIKLEKADWTLLIKKLIHEYKNSMNRMEEGSLVNHAVFIDVGLETKPMIYPTVIIEATPVEEDSLKRKREPEEKTDSEDEEESEQEEKRASLRTSKRKKDKIANEEYSRKKMLDEESAFIQSVKEFYGHIKECPELGDGWDYDYIEDIQLFWEWFDHKVSELDTNYSWDVDTPHTQSDVTLFGDYRTLFTQSSVDIEDMYQCDLKKCVISVNAHNSGVMDTLCVCVMRILQRDIKEKTKMMHHHLLETTTDAIAILGNDLMHLLETDEKTMIRVAELLVDRLIRSMMKSLECNLQPKKKSAVYDLKNTDNLVELCTSWVRLVDNTMFDITLKKFNTNINDPHSLLLTQEEQQWVLRYWFIKGKLCQTQGEVESAYEWYQQCRDVIETRVIDTKCMYDRILDIHTIQHKVDVLKLGADCKEAKVKMRMKEYNAVITSLEPILKPKLSIMTDSMSAMVYMLGEAYARSDHPKEAWECFVNVLSYLIHQLVNYGIKQIKINADMTRDEDIEFFRILRCLNEVINELIELIDSDKGYSGFLLRNDMPILLKMCVYYIFRHPDFIPIVNNFSSNDMPPHAPSKITKSNGFNDLLTKTWRIQSYFIQSSVSVKDNQQIMKAWAVLLQELHDELGEREICGAGGNVLLLHMKDLLTQVDPIGYRRSIYQCYHCLYRIHLASDGDIIEEHHCQHTELDKHSSEPLFSLVVDSIVDKLNHGHLLKSDLKDVLDYITDLFPDLPMQHPHVLRNKGVIQQYLKSEVRMNSLVKMLRNAALPITTVNRHTGLSSVYYKIFWIRGKIFRLQTKNRPKSNNEKNMADLEKAVDEFMVYSKGFICTLIDLLSSSISI